MNKLEQFREDTRLAFGIEIKAETIEEAKKELASKRGELEKKNTRVEHLSIPKSLNEEKRTVDCVIATEAPVLRFDWDDYEYYDEVLLAKGCDLEAAKNGIPFIDGHKWYEGIRAILGTTVNLRVEGNEIIGTRVFANTDFANEAFSLTKDGHLNRQSIGYQINSITKIKPGKKDKVLGEEINNDGERTIVYATKWTPKEDSAVVLPADKNAGVRKENEYLTNVLSDEEDSQTNLTNQTKRSDDEMNKNNIATGVETTETEQQVDLTAERQAAANAATTRTLEIIELCRQHGIADNVRDGFISSEKDINEVRKDVLAELVKRTGEQEAPAAGKITMGRDHIENMMPLMRDAMLVGGGLLNRSNAVEGHKDFAGMNTRDFCIAFLEERGETVKRNISSNELMKRLMTTPDFPLLLETVGIAGVKAGFDEAEETYESFCDMTGSLSSMNPVLVARSTEYLELKETKEGEESEYAYFGEEGDYVRLAKYTRAVPFTEEVIINDQTGEFVRSLGNHGKAVARLEGKMAYDWLTSPPEIGDKAFFHAIWGNLAGTAADLSEASIGNALTALATQTDIDGKPIMINGKFLVVPKNLEPAAKKILMSQVYADSNAAATQYNTIRDAGLKLIADPRLDLFYKASVAGGGKYPWFVLGPKGTTVKFFFLNRQREPIVDQIVNQMRDSIILRVKHRVGSHAVSNKSFYKTVSA